MDKGQQLKSSDFITDVSVGVSDGLTIPFVLATGLAAVVESTDTVILAGLGVAFIGAITMAIGGYAAGKPLGSHQHDDAHTLLNLSKETKGLIDEEIAKDKETLATYINEYGLDMPTLQNARNSALTIGFSYMAAGIIPLLPYIFVATPVDGLKLSITLSACCLFLFGYIKAKVTGQNPWTGALRVATVGCAAAGAAFFIARLFI